MKSITGMFVNGFRCFACDGVQAAEFRGFQCPDCGANLEVEYDYAGAARSLDHGFDRNRPDIFRFWPVLPVRERSTDFPLRVGGTPLYRAGRLGDSVGLPNLFLKDDTCNPSASFKDRATAVALCVAEDVGAAIVSAASTGNAGSSTGCLAAAMGIRAVVFVPESAPPAKLTQLLSYGAQVLAVRGTYDDAYDLCRAASEEFGWFNRSTGFNPYTREGKKTCAYEIWEDLGRSVPDRVIVPTGDGNIISGIWKGWRELRALGLIDRLPKIDCAQSEASDSISRTVHAVQKAGSPNIDWSGVGLREVSATTLADSISVDRPRDGLAAVRAVIESGGEAVTVPDGAIIESVTDISRHTGVFPEPAAAVPLAVARKLARDQKTGADESVVCLITGNGLKDAARAAQAVGTPAVIDPDIAAVSEILQTWIN